MNVIVQAKNLKVTPGMREMLVQQASKLHRYNVQKISAFIETVSRKKNDVFASKIRLHLDIPGENIVVERSGTDIYDVIVDVMDRANRALRKHKEKLITRNRQGIAKTLFEVAPEEEEEPQQ